LNGNNYTAFAFGERNSGKTYCLESREDEQGIYEIIYTKINSALESKKQMLLNKNNNIENQSILNPSLENKIIKKYDYNIKLKFIEIKDEKSFDLLQKYNYFKQPAEIIFTESEGYASVGSAYVNISNIDNYKSIINEALKINENKENKLKTISNKSSTLLTLEISQLFEYKILNEKHQSNSNLNINIQNEEKIENNLVVSKINIVELPSANILIENKTTYNADSYKSIFAFQNLISELVKSNLTFNIDPDIFEFSKLTKLLKEFLGMNSICFGIFNLKKNNFQINQLIFKIMKLTQKIYCYPVINDKNFNLISRKYRNELIYLRGEIKKMDNSGKNNVITPNNNKIKADKFKNNIENESFLSNNDNNLFDAINSNNTSLTDQLKNKIIVLKKEISRLEHELKLSEEDKIKILKDMRNNNSQIQKNNSQSNNKNSSNFPMGNNEIISIDEDIREQMEIMDTLNKLQERFSLILNEKREIEEENLNLKSAYVRLSNDIEKIKSKNNNLVNNLNNEILQLKNLLNSNKAEIEFLRNSRDSTLKIKDNMIQDLDNKDYLLDEKINEIRRQYENKLFEDNSINLKNSEKLKRDLTLKNDNLIDEIFDLKKINQDLIDENKRIQLQNEEIRNSFKDLFRKFDKETKKFNLLDIQNNNNSNLPLNKSNNNILNAQPSNKAPVINQPNNKAPLINQANNKALLINQAKNEPINVVNKINNNSTDINNISENIKNKIFEQKEKYFDSLSLREKELASNLNVEKTKNKYLFDLNKNLKLMIRKMKNIALDYYSSSSDKNIYNNSIQETNKIEEKNEIENLLYGDLENLIQNQENEGLIRFYEFEVKQLRERIVNLENENINKISQNKDQFSNSYSKVNNKKIDETSNKIQLKILEEIEKLKMNSNNDTQNSWYKKELDKLKFENSSLKEEIIKLKRQVVNSSKIIQNENNININKEFNNGNDQNDKLMKKLKIKNDYLEKTLNKLEKENIELKIRANSSEEQLANLQVYISNMNKMKNSLI